MIVVEGDLHSPRPKFMIDSSVSIFLQTCLQIPSSALNTHPGMNLMAPPWSYLSVVSRPASTANRQRPASSSAKAHQMKMK